jgi:hypothetical protein
MRKATRRLLVGAAVAAVLAVAVLVVLVTRTWESPALTRAVLDSLSGPDLRVGAATVRLSPLRGVELRDVTVDARLEDGRLTAGAEEATLSHDPWRLLSGEIRVDSIVVRRPRAEVTWDAEAAPVEADAAAAGPASAAAVDPAAAEPAPWQLDLRVDRFAVEDGELAMREEGVPGEMLRVEGIEVEVTKLSMPAGPGSAVERLAGGGRLDAARLTTPELVSEGVEAGLRLAGGHLFVEALAMPTAFGPVTVDVVDLDLTVEPYVYSLHGAAKPIDTNALLTARSGFGPATLRFAFDGDGSDDPGPRGGGRLEVAAGRLGSLPLLAAVERLLARTELVGRPYEPFAIDYALDGELLTLQPFAVVAGNLRLAGGGRVDLAGPLDLRLEVSLPRADVDVEQIPVEVLEALTDVDGRVKLPIVVAGSLEAPTVGFDRRSWNALARRRLADEAGRRMGDALRGLLDDR